MTQRNSTTSNNRPTSRKSNKVIEKCILIEGLRSWLLPMRILRLPYCIIQNKLNISVHYLDWCYSLVTPKFEQGPQPTSVNSLRGYKLSLSKCTSKIVGNVRVDRVLSDWSHIERVNKASRETAYTFPKEKLGCRIKSET